MQAIADAGLDALVLKTTRGGRYIHIDCSPDYQIDKVRKKVIARRKRGQKKRIVCIWDTTTGVLVYRMPVEWVATSNAEAKKILSRWGKKTIDIKYEMASAGCLLYLVSEVTQESEGNRYLYSYRVTVDERSRRMFSSMRIPSLDFESCRESVCEPIRPKIDAKSKVPYSYFTKFRSILVRTSPGLVILGRRNPDKYLMEPGGSSLFKFQSKYPPAIKRVRANCSALVGRYENENPGFLLPDGFPAILSYFVPGRLRAYALVPSESVAGLTPRTHLVRLREEFKTMIQAGWLRGQLQEKLLAGLEVTEQSLGDGEKVKRVVDRLLSLIERANESMCSVECKSYLSIHLDLLKAG